MNRKLRPAVAIGLATASLSLAVITRLTATAEYEYKRGEYLVAKDGLSPNKQFAIVCGDNKFGVFLIDAKTKELLGELEEVAKGLDTAPEAYRVHWSPDSKHVGICSRWERHYADNVIYRIENRQAFVVESPELRCHAVPDFCGMEEKLTKEKDAEKKRGRNGRDLEHTAERRGLGNQEMAFADAIHHQRRIEIQGKRTRSVCVARKVCQG
jgi:hypothetical protein